MFDLTGKVAFVAGGAGYLGLPVSKGFAEQGARVVIADIDPGRLERAVEEVTAVKPLSGKESPAEKVLGVTFDVRSEESINRAIDESVERFGRLDAVVIATFAHAGPPLEEITSEEFDKALHGNITGAFLLARKASGVMKEGGSIIFYSSMYGVVAPVPQVYEPPMNPNPIEYGSSKAALVQMTRYMAAYYGRRNIRVNAVMPGAFPNLDTQKKEPEFVGRLAERTMLGRIGRRDETAGAVIFLASDEASYITGHLVKIDGGWTAW